VLIALIPGSAAPVLPRILRGHPSVLLDGRVMPGSREDRTAGARGTGQARGARSPLPASATSRRPADGESAARASPARVRAALLVTVAGAPHELRPDFRDGALAGVGHRDPQLDAEQLQRAHHALFAVGGQAPGGGLP